MKSLNTKALFTLTLDVAFDKIQSIGKQNFGTRRIVPVTGGHFQGDKLSGVVLPGADWVLYRPDGAMEIDVRLTLKTDDDCLIYMSYSGLLKATEAGLVKLKAGKRMEPSEYSLRIKPQFETGAEPYAWLNDCFAMGTGEQTPSGPVYSIYEIE